MLNSIPASADVDSGLTPAERDRCISALIDNIERVIFGKADAVRLLMVGLLSRGHVLIEDVPGVGKTMLARALARSIDCSFKRIQFTPDLLPSDIVGVNIYDQGEEVFRFHPGPIFASVILADEINRTPPRTQSSLLEAMSDFQVSLDGHTHSLPEPFIVLATQNPIEYAGTYPLPEAQLDRFLLRLEIGYPPREAELEVLQVQRVRHPLGDLKPVVSASQICALQQAVRQVRVDEALAGYILELADRTRNSRQLRLGVSTRGALMLYRASQARALIEGREFVTPDDIQALTESVWSHRIMPRGAASTGDRNRARETLGEILQSVAVPV